MAWEQGSFLRSLRQRHHLLWLLLGVGFALFLCSKCVRNGAIAIGLLMGLLVVYAGAGEWAARLVARLVLQSPSTRPTVSLFSFSVQVGAFLSILSLLFHLVLLVVLDRNGIVVLQFPMRGSLLFRAAVLPLLAGLGAAAAVSGSALMKSMNVAQGRTSSSRTVPLHSQQQDSGSLPAVGLEPSSLHRSVHQANNLTGPSHRATNAKDQKRAQ